MRKAGIKDGIELFQCTDEEDILACKPDFVLSVSAVVPKVTDFPTYLAFHEPRSSMLDQPQSSKNLFSYDGYLTISDSLSRFIKDFSFGAGRPDEPGFFFLTPQLSDLRFNWNRHDLRESLRVVYFGTNWRRRMPMLFRALDPLGILRIHGPEASWSSERYESYCGPIPFDGGGPQRIYAECGIGLALLDNRWQREDVISNRIFEISSVGAVSICPDMPWVRKWFGDSVFYFDPDRSMREIAEQVNEHYALCLAEPNMAAQMGVEARRIFEMHFAAERMLSNLVRYHEGKTSERAQRLAAMPPAPQISVVLRCGGRSLDFVRRAVDSIRKQSYGKFTVILARYSDIDLSTITQDLSGATTEFVDILIPGGGRAEMLFEGIKRVASPYFAVLDDDDFWLSDHFEELFRAGRQVREDFDIAFSGTVAFDFPVKYRKDLLFNRNIYLFGFEGPINDAVDVAASIHLGSFVAKTSLLSAEMLQVPDMRTGEDTLLLCLLSRKSKPIFSFRATHFYRRNGLDGSNWDNDPRRQDDELAFSYRGGLLWSPEWLSVGSLEAPKRRFCHVKARLGGSRLGEYVHRITHTDIGWRDAEGIIAPPNRAGQISRGPYLSFPPGSYMVILLIVPDSVWIDNVSNCALGYVDVAAPSQGQTFARREFQVDSQELVLPFTITESKADWPLEFRVFSHGRSGFTISSIGVHRYERRPGTEALPDIVEPRQGATQPLAPTPHSQVDVLAPARGHHPSLNPIELATQIDALYRSRSWKITAPLRWVAVKVRGRRR